MRSCYACSGLHKGGELMAWIKLIDPENATGLLNTLYQAAIKRAGKVYQIIRLQSRKPKVLHGSTQLYAELMHSPEGKLTRPQREMIATVVSALNGCHY